MNIQALVSTMNQKNHSILKSTFIRDDVRIVNQLNITNYEHARCINKNVLQINMPEKGVGLSRHMTSSHAEADRAAGDYRANILHVLLISFRVSRNNILKRKFVNYLKQLMTMPERARKPGMTPFVDLIALTELLTTGFLFAKVSTGMMPGEI